MSPVQYLAAAATVLGLAGSLSLVHQTRALQRARRACEVSLALLAFWAVGYTMWFAYGMALANPALVAVNLAGVLGASSTLVVAIRLRRANPCPAPGRDPAVLPACGPRHTASDVGR